MTLSASTRPKSLATRLALFGAVAAVTAAGLATVAPAHAAVVVGTFDPAFGAGVPNLGYRGQASVFVPDACFAIGGFVDNATDPCSLGAMSVLSASVELYNTTTAGQPTLLTLNFNAAAYTVGGVLMVFDGGTGQNEVRGLDTDLGDGLVTALFDAGTSPLATDDINFSGTFWLGFSALAQEATLYTCNPAALLPGDPPCAAASVGAPAVPRFVRVPEPGSVALVLAALGAAGLARRRRPA